MTFKNYKSLKIGDWNFKKLIRASDGLVLFEKYSKPYKYQLKYIQNTNTQFIDTGIAAGDDEIRVEYDIQIEPGSSRRLHGITSSYSDYWGVTDTNYYQLGSYNSNKTKVGNRDIVKWIYSNKTNRLYVNDILQFSASPITATGISNNLYLWAIGTANYYKLTNTKIYGVKIYRNNILETDLIPVIDLDDTICMYDKVSNRFLYNAGTGKFIAGTDIENPYVTDGLISMWDAEFNCFEGLHQTNSTKWIDIVSGYNLELATGTPTWEAKANVINGKWGIVSPELQALFKAANKKNLSYEICFSALPYNIKGTVLGFTGTLNGTIANNNTIGDWCWSVNWIPSNKFDSTRKGTLSVVRNGQTSYTDVYADGEVFGGKRGRGGDPTGKTFGIGYGYGQWNNAPTGIKIHCIRLYNRMLTADEIKKNKDIDANRFLI